MKTVYKFTYTLAFISAFSISAFAQDVTDDGEQAENVTVVKQDKPKQSYPTIAISGKVVDASTGAPLAGAQIKSYNNNNYTAMSDEDGTFTINVPEFVTSLAVNLDGYNLNRVAINGRKTGITVKLFTDNFIDSYKSKTTAVNTSDAQDFGTSTAISIDNEIHNRLGADVRTIQRSAIPGVGNSMFINGYNSLNLNAQPLIVLDGVIYDMQYDQNMAHTGYFNNLLSAINIDDIEDVKVLKNGTAIYGAKAANGVIVINTKRNKSMATSIDVNISAGLETTPTLPDMMGADEYRMYVSQLLNSTSTKLLQFKFLNSDPNYYYYNMYHNNTDWTDVVYNEAWTQNYGIHVSGGDDVASYNVSVGYTDSQSTLKKNDMDRFNIRFNTDINLIKNLSARFDASYSSVSRNLRDDGLISDFSSAPVSSPSMLALLKAPFLSPYDYATNGERSDFVSDADTYLKEILGNEGALANPLGILTNGDAINKNNFQNMTINVAITPKWQINKNLSLQEHFSYTMQSMNEKYYTPIKGMPDYQVEGMGLVNNSRRVMDSQMNSIFSDTRFDWAIPLGSHRLDVFGGARFISDSFTLADVKGYNTGSDKTPTSDNNFKTAVGDDQEWKSLAYYANVDYNYKEKYYLTGQFSLETSSRFGKKGNNGIGLFGVRWGFFPSLQGSWVLSNEDWFHSNKFVNMLKVNAGFESVGNDAIDNSAALTYMSCANLINDKITSIGITNIGNPSLSWETTNRFNVGFEGNFFDNRLNVRFNYFTSKTSNLITYSKLAYVAGLEDYCTNEGALKNNGFDVSVVSKLVNMDKFKMELGASLGHYKNKLSSLSSDVNEHVTDLYGGQVISRVGSPVGLFYGYKTDGVFSTTAEANEANLYIVDNVGTKHYFGAGDIKFVNTNPEVDNCIDENDRVVIGNPNPDVYGNIFANFYIGKHLSVNAGFNYCLGNDIYNYQRSILERGSHFYNQTTAVERHWVVEGQETDIMKVVYSDPLGNSRFSDRWIEDGSYFKLKNLTVNYKFNIKNEYIKGLSVWASANNLFTISKYLGSDPEVSCGNGVLCQGIDAGYLTSGRSFMLGLKINL